MFEDDFDISPELLDMVEADEVAQDLVDLMDKLTLEPGGLETQILESLSGSWTNTYE